MHHSMSHRGADDLPGPEEVRHGQRWVHHSENDPQLNRCADVTRETWSLRMRFCPTRLWSGGDLCCSSIITVTKYQEVYDVLKQLNRYSNVKKVDQRFVLRLLAQIFSLLSQRRKEKYSDWMSWQQRVFWFFWVNPINRLWKCDN